MAHFNNLPWRQLLAFNVSNTRQMQHQCTTLISRNFLCSCKVYKQCVLHLESLSKEHMPLFAIYTSYIIIPTTYIHIRLTYVHKRIDLQAISLLTGEAQGYHSSACFVCDYSLLYSNLSPTCSALNDRAPQFPIILWAGMWRKDVITCIRVKVHSKFFISSSAAIQPEVLFPQYICYFSDDVMKVEFESWSESAKSVRAATRSNSSAQSDHSSMVQMVDRVWEW